MRYQALNIGKDIVKTGWCLANTSECSTAVLQGLNASDSSLIELQMLPISDQDSVNINLTTSQEPLAFRLVAVHENRTTCFDEALQGVHFYRFDSKFAYVDF